jgi:hypothetical protein
MKHTSQQYDLTIGNVEKWRKEREISKTWTASRTRLWFQMRDRGQSRSRRSSNIYEHLCTWSNHLLWVCVVACAICLVFTFSNIVGTIISGRLDQILGGR